jgi:putative acetyltransferase
MIVTRRYASPDLPAMMEVRRSSITRVCARDYTPTQIAAWAAQAQDPVKQDARFRNSVTWVALLEDRVVGYINLGTEGYVDSLYVHAEAQKRGAATALLAALEETARARNVARLHSEVSITARPFFEKRGFSVLTPQVVIVDGIQYDNFRMEKRLRA